MAMWHLTFQRDKPISISRADGIHEKPPEGVIRYVELEHGAWTLEPATDPLGIGGVEWPRACLMHDVTGCAGLMDYVERAPKPIIMSQTGQKVWRSGWLCHACGFQLVGGMGAMSVRGDHWRRPVRRDDGPGPASAGPSTVTPRAPRPPVRPKGPPPSAVAEEVQMQPADRDDVRKP